MKQLLMLAAGLVVAYAFLLEGDVVSLGIGLGLLAGSCLLTESRLQAVCLSAVVIIAFGGITNAVVVDYRVNGASLLLQRTLLFTAVASICLSRRRETGNARCGLWWKVCQLSSGALLLAATGSLALSALLSGSKANTQVMLPVMGLVALLGHLTLSLIRAKSRWGWSAFWQVPVSLTLVVCLTALLRDAIYVATRFEMEHEGRTGLKLVSDFARIDNRLVGTPALDAAMDSSHHADARVREFSIGAFSVLRTGWRWELYALPNDLDLSAPDWPSSPYFVAPTAPPHFSMIAHRLSELLKDNARRVRISALRMFQEMGPCAAEHVPEILAALERDGHVQQFQRSQSKATEDVRQNPAEDLEKLQRGMVRFRDAVAVRVAAANSLGCIGPLATDGEARMIELLHDVFPQVQQAAAAALGSMGPAAASAVPELHSLVMTSSLPATQMSAAAAIWSIDTDDTSVDGVMQNLLQSDDPEVVAACAGHVLRMRREPRDWEIPALIGLTQHESVVVRHRAAYALSQLAIDSDSAVEASVQGFLPELVSGMPETADQHWGMKRLMEDTTGSQAEIVQRLMRPLMPQIPDQP